MTYVIKQKSYFYGPSTETSYVSNDTPIGFERVIFASRAAAESWIAAHDAVIYHLDHNEYDRPHFTIIKNGAVT